MGQGRLGHLFNSCTPKQRAFIAEYPKDMNATLAAKRAGYAGDDNALAVQGSRLIRHHKANPLIRKLTAATADEMGITREYLLDRIDAVATRAQEGAPKILANGTVAKDDEGNVIYEWSPQGAARALELLAKLRGDMIERKEVDVRVVELRVNGVEMGDLR